MYPQRDLTRLAARKTAVRGRIAEQRAAVADTAGRLIRPLVQLERLLSAAGRFLRGAAVPLGLLAGHTVLRRSRPLSLLLRWSPLLLAAVRALARRPAGPR